ncbi:SRPBCC family protein [Subtercola vilae]|uniref:SRPBCC family protein n=1 Tax=Subtercola vilae TaxID=2056433 RepID=A0A4T2C8A9_9MICO|nr:SRPBCC family protein [Subtercola vilae]TIH40129.1 SRPBCC family protein [Subtercola vilae]
MSTNHRTVNCTPEDVFAVIANGWFFPNWVVGASRMRDVDTSWPHVGSRLHHSFGVWPVLINDETTSLQWNPPHRAVMQAKGWPLGEARVTVEVQPHPKGCRVTIIERPVKGPTTLIPHTLLNPALFIRNIETLRRLAFMAENHAGGNLTAQLQPTGADQALPDRPSNRGALRIALIGVVVGIVVGAARRAA